MTIIDNDNLDPKTKNRIELIITALKNLEENNQLVPVEGLTGNQIAQLANISRATVRKKINALVSLGLIERNNNYKPATLFSKNNNRPVPPSDRHFEAIAELLMSEKSRFSGVRSDTIYKQLQENKTGLSDTILRETIFIMNLLDLIEIKHVGPYKFIKISDKFNN